MSDTEAYQDPIIDLVKDNDLFKEKEKTNQLIRLIDSFPLTERRISKLCHKSFAILQRLEKISLQLKSWEFMSLTINSDTHFTNTDDLIKNFNNNIAEKVLDISQDLNQKLTRISVDLDHITIGVRSLTPIEYISDSGTVLSSLLLKNVKLKAELADKLTVSYSIAKLIGIGKELEEMSASTDDGTISSYKIFILSILKQLNSSIEDEDMELKYECLAVINDMEKMFNAFKLQKMKDAFLDQALLPETEEDDEYEEYDDTPSPDSPHDHHLNQSSFLHNSMEDADFYNSDSASYLYSSNYSQSPMVHSITKNSEASKFHNHENDDGMSASLLQKTSITSELPYLMSAFNSAKNFEEDVTHYKKEENLDRQTVSKRQLDPPKKNNKPVFSHKSHLPESVLYSESTIIPRSTSPGISNLYRNNSLLAKMGIKPQIISTKAPKRELMDSSKSNLDNKASKQILLEGGGSDKENGKTEMALTAENLERFSLANLNKRPLYEDFVD
ncbi:uncharacterized protein PRCAT00006241001 [Priceomyces carsonii]|uniref:uncharacterized protein n=1 Tax=Priceomyces carsonii TaxID=28549 RepID=UPI002ED97820|nr:unnamed protein product [Priceomyces carsonii]